MASDPRNFIISDCDRGRQASISNTTARKSFYAQKNAGVGSAAGKIGDFELLNDLPGVNVVAKGLRTLSELSDTTRDTGVPPQIGDPVEYLGDKIGVTAGAVQAVSKFNPGVANRYVDQAQNVMGKVISGDFGFEDIPGAFQDLNNLATLANGIMSGPAGADSVDAPACFASPYAESLAYEYSPKMPFLFIVEFIFNENQISFPESPKTMAHLIKTSSRPNVRFEYEEVNMYNFRTKVPKRTEFEPMIMTFHDDQKDSSLFAVYKEYLNRISPITRINPTDSSSIYEENGMSFDDQSTASIGALSGNQRTIFKEIRLYHITNYGKNVDVFHFANPKIEEMQLSDLDMATSDPAQVQIQFAYDGLYLEPMQPLTDDDINIKDLTNFGKWPIQYDGSSQASSSAPPESGTGEEDYSVFGIDAGGVGSILDDAASGLLTTIPSASDLLEGPQQLITDAIDLNTFS